MATNSSEYDAIVVGAGVAGICCAGELVVQGMNPLLICETKEVAHNLRPVWIKGNRTVIQAAVISPLQTSGWWWPLARALGADLGAITYQLPISVSFWGSKDFSYLHQWYLSASSMVEAFEAISPIPFGEHRSEVERVLRTAMAIPFDELTEMDDVMWTDWLAEQHTDEFTTNLLNFMAALVCVLPTDLLSHVTAFGVLMYVRALIGESHFPEAVPDYREGIFIPIAQAIERQGGTVWRGRKVDRVLTDGGKVEGVLLKDGTEVRAPVVAVATGNPRIPSLFDQRPPEVERIANFEYGDRAMMGYYTISLLEREVLPSTFRHWHGVFSLEPEWTQWIWPGHVRTPWGVQPGKQLLTSGVWYPKSRVDELFGGAEGLYKQMQDVEEFYFPGIRDAIEERMTLERGGMWYSQVMKQDKLPRRSESVDGLWYVGDGSVPIRAAWTEAAASAGILGARDISVDYKKKG